MIEEAASATKDFDSKKISVQVSQAGAETRLLNNSSPVEGERQDGSALDTFKAKS